MADITGSFTAQDPGLLVFYDAAGETIGSFQDPGRFYRSPYRFGKKAIRNVVVRADHSVDEEASVRATAAEQARYDVWYQSEERVRVEAFLTRLFDARQEAWEARKPKKRTAA